MVSSKMSWFGLFMLAAFSALGCGPEPYTSVLTQACSSNFGDGCIPTGDAKRVAGLTVDAEAYAFGPKGGTLRVPLRAALNTQVAISDNTIVLDVLASATTDDVGSLTTSIDWKDCSTCPVDTERVEFNVLADYEWFRALDDLVWNPNFANVQPDIVIEGRNVVVADLRVPSEDLASNSPTDD